MQSTQLSGSCLIASRQSSLNITSIYFIYLVNLFRNPKINKNGAQLIFMTHETTLLSLDTFRRDQIYFTEKNPETGVTDLYSLDDLSVRKDENIEKGYLLGRYGAIPYLQTEDIV